MFAPNFSGWVVVGVWIKMIGRLEGTFPELFLSICLSKLEASQAFLQRLHLFLKMDVTTSIIFIFCVFRSKSSVIDSWGTYFSSRCMHDKCMTCNLYDKLALRGVTYDRNSCIMKQESWLLPKLYNEIFLSDGHCVTHKSWVEDASRRDCPDANNNSTYNLRTCSIHYVNMGRFSTWSQKGLISAQWRSS
jgi:hypothetical protein